ncbi:MAG: formate C-acetyltransferase/glycerol dehydratase family glycyl radical enzyme [Candidatus Hermodarchaeota archaeon]
MTTTFLSDLVKGIPTISVKVPLFYTKALKENQGKPLIISQAKGLKATLENLPIIIRPDEIIVGTFDEKVPVAIPRFEASGYRIMKELDTLPNRIVNPINIQEADAKLLREQIYPFYDKFKVDTFARELAPDIFFETSYSGCAYIATEIGGIAHVVVDYKRLISLGFKKYVEESKKLVEKSAQLLKRDILADEKIAFYKAMIITCEALIKFAAKYAEKADSLAQTEKDLSRKEELIRIAETCRNIPLNPPQNLQEAVQFIWFIHLALHLENFEHGISFGRIDQYLLPYYDGNEEYALKLIKNLLLKTNEIIALYDNVATQYFGGMATTQNILIGGIDRSGKDSTNALTYLFLRATDELSVPSPNLVVRIHNNSPSNILKKIAQILSKGNNLIGIYNDETVVKSLMKYGIPLEEARDYGIVGCVGLSTSGTSYDNTGAVFLNTAKALELALGTDKTIVNSYINNNPEAEKFSSMDEILVVFKEKLSTMMEMAAVAANAYQQALKHLKPTPLMSLCIRNCFEQGIDVNKGSAKYNFSGIHVTGFTDVVDSLAAINWAIFDQKELTMRELIDAIKNNFRGYRKQQNYLIQRCPKYGNDDDRADIYAKKVAEILVESIKGLKSARGGDYRVGIHAMTTHVGFGIFTGALPSGRKKGKPLNRDIAPGSNVENGLTAAINSVTKIDHSLFGNGLACTFNINPTITTIKDGDIFESILRTYTKLHGSHLQFNAFSIETLEDAQKNPSLYNDLMVRVSGYSARFIDLPKAVQDDIMVRFRYNKY